MFDLIIRGAEICVGSGVPRVEGSARRALDADGRVAAPGFVDVHTPCRPAHRELLVEMLLSVEGLPPAALQAGIHWVWETLPEYLDTLERPATADDLARTQAVVRGELRAMPNGGGFVAALGPSWEYILLRLSPLSAHAAFIEHVQVNEVSLSDASLQTDARSGAVLQGA